jgi:uncharacterized protein (DUF1800 family)
LRAAFHWKQFSSFILGRLIMKTKFSPLGFFTPFAQRLMALATLIFLLTGSLNAVPAAAAVENGKTAAAARMSDDKKILHVLNRLGFGARPGDVERVRQIGLQRYIEQQLHPETINDSATTARLAAFPSLQMTTPEIFAKYPGPGALFRVLQRTGNLPPELADAQNKKQAKAAIKGTPNDQSPQTASAANAPNAANASGNDMAMTAEQQGQAAEAQAAKLDSPNNPNRQAYRRALRDFMMQNDLRPPAQLMQELQASRIVRATYSDRQLYEQMVDFWENHFNIYAQKGADRWLLTSFDRDTIRPYAMGNFRDLLEATAKSPAMLFYLDNFQSVSPNAPQGNPNRQMRRQQNGAFGNDPLMRPARRAAIGNGSFGGLGNPRVNQMPQPQAAKQQQAKKNKRGLNENYARELMELHTLGVDGGYTQQDVIEVARCFTGWTIFDPRGYTAYVAAVENKGSDPGMNNLGGRSGTFYFNARLHDNGEKTVLGHKIPAGGGMKDAEMVLDILASHPSTAKFISTKIARWFVSDDPPASLVARMSETFLKTNGDIRAVLSTMINSPEFFSPEAYRAKIKTPFELAVSSIRALNGETNGGPALQNWIARMGQPLYGYQTPNGYPDRADQWVNTGALLERMNFALALVGNRIAGTRVDVAQFVKDNPDREAVDYRRNRLIDQFADVILQGDISEKTRAGLIKALNDAAANPQSASNATGASGTNTANGDAMQMNGDAMENEQIASAADERPFRAKPGGKGKRQNYPTPVVGNAVTSDVQRIAALILGSPEFQRQ